MRTKYFEFLCEIVGRFSEYKLLLRRLFEREFYSLLPQDDNRACDGLELRNTFINEIGVYMAPSLFQNYIEGPCTVLELLIGIAYRIEYELTGGPYQQSVSQIFWELIRNLELEGFDNKEFCDNGPLVDEYLTIFMDRTYMRNGRGGLFPLKNPEKNQRKVEIWYQMHEYIMTNYGI